MSPRFVSGFGASHSERIRPYSTIDLAGIRALIDEPPSLDKLQAQWIIPSTLLTRTFQEQEEDGQFWLLWADLDQNPPGLDTVAQLLQPLLCDYEIYTSRSATVETPKCRILIPLATPLTGSEWRLAQEVLNDTLQAGGAIPDRANERCGQLCFLPNRGQFYDVRSRRLGECFDPLVFWADLIEAKRVALLEAERVVQERRELALARKASLSPRTTPSLIDAFNQTYPVEEILLCAGYAQRGAHFRHPYSQSGSYSASVKDGRVHTLSTSDPLYSDGQGAHDAFSAFSVLFAGGDTAKALKLAGDEWLRIGDESWNAVQRREYAIAHAPKEIDVSGLLLNGRDKPHEITVPSKSTPSVLSEQSIEKFSLDRFVLNGSSAQLEAQMLDDVYVLGRLAILGQSTAIYAPPNAGKTLITLALIIQAITNQQIHGKQVYYINADDNFKGLVTKLKLAEEHGFQMIAPHYKDFKLEEFGQYLLKLIKAQTAWGVVVILDTVKKFTDIMNKRVASEFGKVIRAFVQAGGTVIMLAHVNKHRDEDDKPVAAGTSDLIDDADCAYILDTHEHGPGEYLATFENIKSRGDVVPKVTYRFVRQAGQEYVVLLASVTVVSQDELTQLAKEEVLRASREKHGDLIECIKTVITAGTNTKTDIIATVQKETKQAREQIRKVLETHTGEYYLMGYYWQVSGGKNNAQIYTLLNPNEHPSTVINEDEHFIPAKENVLQHTTANPENPANPINTGVLDSANRLANSANCANQIIVSLRGMNATSINTCQVVPQALRVEVPPHLVMSSSMVAYLQAKGRISLEGDHHG